MKNLILLRHAKSSWKDLRLGDFDRPLNNRGKQTAPLIAKILLSKNIFIDKIISSSSKRTTETSKIFAAILSYEPEIIYEPNLYLASFPFFEFSTIFIWLSIISIAFCSIVFCICIYFKLLIPKEGQPITAYKRKLPNAKGSAS